MRLHLRQLAPEIYAQQILPLTEAVWSQGRTLERYVGQTLELAGTTYGRRHYRTYALSDGEGPLASFKRYEREARIQHQRLRAIGIAAVFTAQEHRGRGYATAMLGMALDEACREGFDFAYLFSDIHPEFYKALGFRQVPSRAISVRAETLNGDRIGARPLTIKDWSSVRKCFQCCDERRGFGLTRSPLVWDWIRTRLRHRSERARAQPVQLVVDRGSSIAAYVIGQREPAHDAYVVDEFAFVDDQAATMVAPLLRSAAGDLRRVVAWLPPLPARNVLPRGSVRTRPNAIWMIAPLTARGSRFSDLASQTGPGDGIWALDHI